MNSNEDTYEEDNVDTDRFHMAIIYKYNTLINGKISLNKFQNIDDFNAGINTVGFTTISKNGIHNFEIFEQQDTLKDIRVINGGSNYENRQLHVNQ